MHYFIIAVFALFRSSQAYYQRNCTLRHPTQAVCGEAGNDNDPPLVPRFTVSSFEVCRDIALATLTHPSNKPASFSFDTKNSQCSIYKTGIPGFKKNAGSTTKFYQPACFDCLISCPLAYEENILVNGGFEIGRGTVAPWLQEISQPGYDSEHKADPPLEMFQIMPLCTSATYKLAFYYKVTGITNPEPFQFHYYVQGFNKSFVDSLEGVIFARNTHGAWSRFEDVIVVPAKKVPGVAPPGLKLQVGGHRKAKMFLDDVQFYAIDPVAARTPKSGSPNLFSNPGFESGMRTPWYSGIAYDGPGNTSDHARISVVSPGINSDHGLLCESLSRRLVFFFFSQKVTTTPFTQYVVSFDYRVKLRPNAQRSTATLDLEYTSDGGGRRVSVTRPPFKRHLEGVYSEVVPVVADGDTLTIQIEFLSRDGEDFLFDNFQIVEASS